MALTPDQVDQLQQWYHGYLNPNSTINIGGNTYGVTGVSHNDEGGQSFSPDSLIQFDPSQITNPGYEYNVIDPNTGNTSFTRQVMNGGAYDLSDFKDLGQAAAVLGSMYLGGAGLSAMGAGSAAGIGGSGFAAGAGEAAAGAGTAGAVGGSGAFLGEGAASGIPAWDGAYTAAGGTFGDAGAGADLAGDWGPGPDLYDPATMPTEADVGGGAIPDATDPNYVNGSDMQSDVATSTGTAPAGSVNAGTSTPSFPNPTTSTGTGTGTGSGTKIPSIPGGTNTGSGTTGGTGNGIDLGSILQLLGGAYGMNQQNQASHDMLDYLKSRQQMNDNMYAPGSPEYNTLWDEMSRKDAAAGRNSQYGPRSVDLAARIAQLKMDANTKLTSGIANNMASAINQGSNSYLNMLPGLMSLTGGGSGGGFSLTDLTNLVKKLPSFNFSDSSTTSGTAVDSGTGGGFGTGNNYGNEDIGQYL